MYMYIRMYMYMYMCMHVLSGSRRSIHSLLFGSNSIVCTYSILLFTYTCTLQDEFRVYKRSRRTAAKRHVFLQDQRLILTKEKDADGMYVFKDSLKVSG